MKKSLFFSLLMVIQLNVVAQQTSPQLLSCGFSDENISPQILQLMKNLPLSPQKSARQGVEPLREMRILVVVDSTIYGYYKQDINQIKAHIAVTYQQANLVFEGEVGVHLNVVAIEILKKGKNYNFNTRGVSSKYGQFYNFINDYEKRADVKRDLTVLWTLPTGEPYSGLTTIDNNVSYYHVTGKQLSQELILHETGHALGSPHTNNCRWEGGPLDFCGPTEGDCYTGVRTFNFSTIMSLCGSIGVGGILKFHPQCVELMKKTSDLFGLSIMSIIPSQKPSLLFPTNKQENIPPLSYFSWDATELTLNYQMQVADKSDFSTVIVDTTVSNNSILFTHTLSRNITYYWRVRSINAVGAGAWSEVFSFKTQINLALPKPVIYEINNIRTYEDQILSFSPIPNAKEYEIAFHSNRNNALTALTDANQYKVFKIKKTRISLGELLDAKNNAGIYRWRVRALTDSLKSDWSDDDTYRNTVSLYNKIATTDYTSSAFSSSTYNIPTTFPLRIFSEFSDLDDLRNYKVEIANNIDFKNIILTKEQSSVFSNKPDATMNQSVVIDGLQPDKKYYFRVKAKTRIDSVTSNINEFRTGIEERWNLSSYLNNNLLPQNAYLHSIFIDKDNNKWLYGEYGIYQLKTDGSTVAYNSENTNGVLCDNVNSIAQDSKGRIWAATEDGLAVLENNKWINNRKGQFGSFNGQYWNNSFSKVVSAPNNVIYAGGNRILRFDGSTWEVISQDGGIGPGSLFNVDKEGNLWTSTYNKGVMLFENGVWNKVKIDSAEPYPRKIDNKGNMWWYYTSNANIITYLVVSLSSKSEVKKVNDNIEIVQSLTGVKSMF